MPVAENVVPVGQVAQRLLRRRPAPRPCRASRPARPSRSRRARGRRPGRPCLSSSRCSEVSWPRSKISYSGTMPRSCIRVCSSTMNSQRFRKTSSPKLTVPIVQEAMSGPASSTASRSASGSVHRAAAGQLDDQVGADSRSAATVSRSRPRSSVGLGLVVADVDVDHARAERLALLGGGDQLVERHRQRRHVGLGRLGAGGRHRDQRPLSSCAGDPDVTAQRVDRRRRLADRRAASSGTFRLTTASAIVPELVVADRGADEADRPAVRASPACRAAAAASVVMPSRCSSTSRRGGRPRWCTRATVSCPR